MLPLIGLIPLLPLAGFVVNGLLGRRFLSRQAVAVVACGSVLLAFLLSVGAVWELNRPGGLESRAEEARAGTEVDVEGRRYEISLWEWMAPGKARTSDGHAFDFRLAWGYQLDPLSSILLLVVTGVGLLIHFYSVGYMEHEEGFARFFTYLNLFMAMMLVLVLGASFPVLFVGWEGVGLCSYLLIGFYYDRPFDLKTGLTCADAGRKAFMVNRIGDLGFLLGMLLVLVTFGSLDFSTVSGAVAESTAAGWVFPAIGLLLFVGAAGKSAQIPLYVWLPDAMAGPTPVSALIHAATMVTAGVYMICRTSAIYVQAPEAMATVATLGAATAVLAALIGIAQTDIKKILAYSTVSQLGYMFLAAGVGAYGAAVFHLLTHAFFKALLFLGAGAVIHSLSGEQDIRHMGGLRKLLPITFWVMFIATLAIAGVPGLAGFFSKDEILWRAFGAVPGAGFHGHPLLWAAGAFAAGLTAFYMFRLLFLVFSGAPRMDEKTRHHVHESPWIMLAPLCVLAVLSVFGGYLGVPHALGGSNWIERYLHPSFSAASHEPAGHLIASPAAHAPAAGSAAAHADLESGAAHAASPALEYGLMLASVLIAGAGILTAWLFYVRRPSLPARLAGSAGALYRAVAGKFYVDEIYAAVVLGPYDRACALSAWFDQRIVDGVVNGARHLTVAGAHISSLFDKYVIDLLVNVLGWITKGFHFLFRRVQTGLVQSYAAAMVFGVFLLVSLYLIMLAGGR